MQEKGEQISLDEVIESIRFRDESDKHKEIGALLMAEDAVVIDTTKLSIEEVAQKISSIVEEKGLK